MQEQRQHTTLSNGAAPAAPYFQDLRSNAWFPRFHHLEDLDRCADTINLPHEDYPRRSAATRQAIVDLEETVRDSSRNANAFPPVIKTVQDLHRAIFSDHGARAGQWRTVNVRVADHLAPDWSLLPNLMNQLEILYQDTEVTLDNLVAWYYDFETIHSFVDGNGRTGGVFIAALHHLRFGAYLTPGQ